jgi:hypothetical protein
MDNAKILEVNQRLKRAESWVGYRCSKGSNGEKVPSKFLYYAFYQHSTQKFINSKTNDPKDAYRQLLDARKATTEGVRLLPSEVSRIRDEDLRAILLDCYREHKPRSITKRHTGKTDSDGNKLTEEVLLAPTSWISFSVKWHRKEGDADPTIRRQLGNLRSAFTQVKAFDLITDSDIPTFVLPAVKTSTGISRSSGVQYFSRGYASKVATYARLSSRLGSSRRRPLRGLGGGRALNLGGRSCTS